ncbi:MAG: ABC transporter ATP-binding protein [Elusimicrobiota bacterium]
MYAIKTESLTKVYRKRHLGRTYLTPGISDINLEISQGEIFGLLGLNGSGKTTTIKLLVGLLFPTSGKINIFGNTMPDRKKLSLIGYLPEMPYFQKFFTGRETLEFFLELSGETNSKRINEIIDRMGMSDYIDKRIGEFSKGMMQRLTIAQTLLNDPPLFIFDELVSGLDPMGIHDMRNFVLELKKRGKTIFFSSHLISEVERVCDRVGIIQGGKLLKILTQKEWQSIPLEDIFLNTIRSQTHPVS